MAKVPDDIKKKMEIYCKETETDLDELKGKFQEIYKTHENCVAVENEEVRMRIAGGVLFGGLTATGGKGVPIVIKVVSKSATRRVGADDKKVADIYAFTKEMDEDGEAVLPDMKYANLTFWQDAVATLDDVKEEGIYKLNMVPDDPQPEWGASYHTGSPDTKFEKVDVAFPALREFFDDEIVPLEAEVPLSQIDMHISDNTLDLRVIKATVVRADKGNDKKNGKPYAVFDVIDDTLLTEKFTVWCTPSQLIGGVGSIIYIIGHVVQSKKGGGAFMNAHFVLPFSKTSLTPLRLVPKPVKPKSAEEEPERDKENEASDVDESMEF